MSFKIPRVWAEIDLAAWRDNYRAMAAFASPAEVLPVIKADAYGLGVRPAATAFAQAGARRFVVSCLEEAEEILDFGKPIQLLGAPVPEEIPGIVAHGLIASVPDLRAAQLLRREAGKQNKACRFHFQIDSGMGHLGIRLDQARGTIAEIAKLPGLEPEGIYSHFPMAEAKDPATFVQAEKIAKLIRDLEAIGLKLPVRHLANSAGLACIPAAHLPPFTAVRPGIDLHGATMPDELPLPYPLRQVVTLKARLVSVRPLPTGESVGYGRTYRAAHDEQIGCVAIGYADGYHRDLSNRGIMLVRGRRCPVVGRVCMDYTTISLAAVPEAEVGDDVVVYGYQDGQLLSIGEVAVLAGTISYELLTKTGRRVVRQYHDNGETVAF